MNIEIGEAAGKIWHFLNGNPRSTLGQISKSLALDASLARMAVGWLAREDKIFFEGKGTKVKVSPK